MPKAAVAQTQKNNPQTKVVDRDNAGDPDAEEGAGGGPADDDEAIAAFFQEVKQEVKSVHVIRKVSGHQGLDVVKLGPDFVDEDYYECTPVPLWQRPQPILDYDTFLERVDDDVLVLTPIKPQTFSALFAFYRDRGPALNWDPHLTDLEEDCFYQDLIHWPSKKLTHSLPRESKKEPVPKKRVKDFKPSGDYIYKTRLTISLQECPTVILFEIKGVMILESDAKYEDTKKKNERYAEMVKDHIVSDTYANDYAQSFEDYTLSKHTDYKIDGCRDAGTEVHSYFIVDEYIKVAAEDARRKIIEEDNAAARALAEKARLEIPEGGWKDSDSDDSDDQGNAEILDFRTDISKYKEEEEDNRAMIMDEASDDEIAMTSDDEEYEIRQPLDILYENKKQIERRRPPRYYPDISFSLIAMERIICMDSQQMRQADMRGLIEPEVEKPPPSIKSDEDSVKGEELDEDAMVSLIIQQHRMQEQLELHGSVDEGIPSIIMPDAQDAGDGRKDEDEDDDLLEEANAAEEAERRRQEQLKAEKEAAEIAAKEAALAALLQQRLTNLKKKTNPTTIADQSEGGDNTSKQGGGGAVPSTNFDVSSIADAPDSGSKVVDEQTPPVGVEKPEIKTIAAPPQLRPPPPSGGGPPGQAPAKSSMDQGTADLKCTWTETDENIDEEKKLEEEALAEVKDVIDDVPLDLPQFNPEEGLSEDEDTFGSRMKKKDFTSDMAEMEDSIAVAAPAPPPKPGSAPKSSKDQPEAGVDGIDSKRGSAEEEMEQKKEEKKEGDDEFDDISSDETHHENSELSDHLVLTEDLSSDSEASEKLATNRKRSSAAMKIFTDFGPPEESPTVSPGPHLRQYWNFKCKETAGMEVTDITHHPLNENIIAASYGSFRFGDHEKEGLVCIWNAKNNRSPERLYKLRAPGISLAFSELTPFVLAVGMLDGNIVLFDVREDDATVLGATIDQKIYHGHVGPVWQIYFLIQVDSSNDDVVEESMLSLGDDGFLKRWSITKGLESTIVMKVGRSTMQVPGRREKRSESLITTLSIAYTVCFFPNNSDLFLLGTEEGFIHKCSTAYKESYVTTYVGHTGPVYRVAFSNFDDQVFFSCGGDWTVKMWKLDHLVPLLSLQTGHRSIFDVTGSFFSSTLFVCATEYHIEVWDLSINTLEPVVRYKPPFAVGLRKVAFNGLLNSVMIGDDEGSLTIYGVRNFPKGPPSRHAQRELLLESLLPGYKRRKEAEEADRLKRAARASE
ncbi:WD repeat-containing protein 78 [Orchesella cincta]|uniref:Dynein axonemal intermediate chain 4 n=1 Tax=Orchesella cincta TaxID=48709 RepID=A0A1D2NC89_ORCCI|nr:WD repeat-containing protein 78 [Orchesella cincta]